MIIHCCSTYLALDSNTTITTPSIIIIIIIVIIIITITIPIIIIIIITIIILLIIIITDILRRLTFLASNMLIHEGKESLQKFFCHSHFVIGGNLAICSPFKKHHAKFKKGK